MRELLGAFVGLVPGFEDFTVAEFGGGFIGSGRGSSDLISVGGM